jgi:hypothetical protein
LADVGWRLAELTALLAEQFMTDIPHGGDVAAVQVTFASARN